MFGTQPYETEPPKTTPHRSSRTTNKQLSSQLGRVPVTDDDAIFKGNPQDLLFSLEELRKPTAKQSKELKQKILLLRKMHRKIDNDFLDNRLEPRLIVIIADCVDLKQKEEAENSWEPRHYSNVTINVNKYIAKYDYDIGQVMQSSNARRHEADELNFRKAAVYEIMQICTSELAEGKKVF